MGSSKVARILLVLGAALGIAGVAALALDIRINIPDWMIQVAMIKLALIGSAGLLGAGALLGRHANRRAQLQDDRARALTEAFPDFDRRVEEVDSVRSTRDNYEG